MTDKLPLHGLKVLEFSHTVMGPCAGLILADLGADVIKVEPAPAGDKTRELAGFASGFFAAFNRNKRSLAIDLKQVESQQAIQTLVESTDVVLENYGPGTMEKLGCDWETLSPLNPKLVFLSLKGYLGGPWQDRPALDEVVQFQSGLAYMTGLPGQPLRAGASIVDILGAVFGVTGTLAALRQREATGEGQRVGSSLFESAAFMMSSHITGGLATGEQVPPMTARKGAWGIYDTFGTADGEQLFVGVTSDAQWFRFCEAFGFEDLADNREIATNEQRRLSRDWLIPELQTRFNTMTLPELIAGCQRADISWSPVGRPEQLCDNEQLLHGTGGGGLLETFLDTAISSVRKEAMVPGLPLEFGPDRARLRLRTQPPAVGQHSLAVLQEHGVQQEVIEALLQSESVVQSSSSDSSP